MKKLITVFSFVFLFINTAKSDDYSKIFSKDEVKKIAGAYLENKLDFENPVFVDIDFDGDFDALNFDNGNVEYHKNVGTLEGPSFVLENKHYDEYNPALFVVVKMPYPMFFADSDGDKDLDMFVIKDKVYDKSQHKYNYKVASAENSVDLDTGTLITIILVLVIVLLILAIVR